MTDIDAMCKEKRAEIKMIIQGAHRPPRALRPAPHARAPCRLLPAVACAS